jgi:hypothetical protein
LGGVVATGNIIASYFSVKKEKKGEINNKIRALYTQQQPETVRFFFFRLLLFISHPSRM